MAKAKKEKNLKNGDDPIENVTPVETPTESTEPIEIVEEVELSAEEVLGEDEVTTFPEIEDLGPLDEVEEPIETPVVENTTTIDLGTIPADEVEETIEAAIEEIENFRDEELFEFEHDLFELLLVANKKLDVLKKKVKTLNPSTRLDATAKILSDIFAYNEACKDRLIDLNA